MGAVCHLIAIPLVTLSRGGHSRGGATATGVCTCQSHTSQLISLKFAEYEIPPEGPGVRTWLQTTPICSELHIRFLQGVS